MNRSTARSPLPGARPARSVRDMLMEAGRNFSKAELLVVRQLLANYPAAGLTTISRLAQLAGVSDPTVLRVATRLGFGGFAELQQALLAEVEAHMRSPLTLVPAEPMPRAGGTASPNAYQAFLTETLAQVEAVRNGTATADYERVVGLLGDRRLRIAFLGGRFSRFIAGLMYKCLNHMREGSMHLDGTRADIIDELAVFDRRHVLVVFDYRRYQTDVVNFAEQAKRRGSQIVLFTDRWKSPIARLADVTLVAPTETASPFDTLVTPLVQVEAIIAGLAADMGEDWRERAAILEQVRAENGITLAVTERDGRTRRKPATPKR